VTDRLRAVFDTNIFVSAFLSRNPSSPTRELVRRWQDGELACAVVGRAAYLVTYDAHFDVLGGSFEGVKITKALPFLWELRGESAP
jgi:predicted nucleic acid-binding protein